MLMKVVIAAEGRRYHLFSAYAPQTGCSERAKDEFWSLLDEKTAEVPLQDVIIVAGDLNGHVGAAKDGYGCHDGLGFGSRNADGERILEYAEFHDLTNVNARFRKPKSYLISFYNGNSKAQIDFVLVRNRDQGLERSIKDQVVPSERKGSSWTSCIRLPTVTTVDETGQNATNAIRDSQCCAFRSRHCETGTA
ncbi:unnamed protein product [Heligmosomoides polygyrus]|uniref:Endo/exonuclease/phosphatase domain-containing protein n=1 Tax=Heligmosomoides polygyrus TaxID=6339 RepID=A0A183FH04_HELPZ|nr:unnamed protein product [Heligmosomoides polygyrus]